VDATSQWGLFPAVVAGVCWAGQLWYVGYGLDPGRLTGGFWRRLLGLANVVTLVRGALYAVVAGFVVVPSETALAWVPALCYGTGVALDKLDGIVARTVGRQTELGRRLDMAFDTFGFVVAPLGSGAGGCCRSGTSRSPPHATSFAGPCGCGASAGSQSGTFPTATSESTSRESK